MPDAWGLSREVTELGWNPPEPPKGSSSPCWLVLTVSFQLRAYLGPSAVTGFPTRRASLALGVWFPNRGKREREELLCLLCPGFRGHSDVHADPRGASGPHPSMCQQGSGEHVGQIHDVPASSISSEP